MNPVPIQGSRLRSPREARTGPCTAAEMVASKPYRNAVEYKPTQTLNQRMLLMSWTALTAAVSGSWVIEPSDSGPAMFFDSVNGELPSAPGDIFSATSFEGESCSRSEPITARVQEGKDTALPIGRGSGAERMDDSRWFIFGFKKRQDGATNAAVCR